MQTTHILHSIQLKGKCLSKVEVKVTPGFGLDPNINGVFKKSLEKVNGHDLFVSEYLFEKTKTPMFGIWLACGDRWCVNNMIQKGHCSCQAFSTESSKCLSSINDNKWIIYNSTEASWINAGSNFETKKARGELIHK